MEIHKITGISGRVFQKHCTELTILMSDKMLKIYVICMGSVLTHTLCIIILVNVFGLNSILERNGIENLTDEEAAEIIATDRDSSQHNLLEAIEKS